MREGCRKAVINTIVGTVHHAATFKQAKADEFGPYDYSRSGNPTRDALEAIIASLEGGKRVS